MTAPRPVRVLVTGGGTGGHVYPGLAVAEALRALDPDLEIRFVGTRRGLERVLVPRAGWPLDFVPASGFRGLGPVGRLVFLGNLAAGTLRSLVLLARRRPHIVLGTGGYVCAPVLLAGRLAGVPCALQEQNAVPGSANRLVGRWARRVYLGFGEAARWFPAGVCVETGNPVRGAFAAQAPAAPRAPGAPLRLLVFGGSRGAHTLNAAVAAAAPAWAQADLELLAQTGPADLAEVQAAWAGADPQRVRIVPYIEDMAGALAWADLVVCRAGAMTLAELQAAGRPAVLVPFPFATDDHQRLNAEACARAGAAVVLPDERCDGPTLTGTVAELGADPARLQAMGAAARQLARPQAAVTIARDLLHMIGHPAGAPARAG
ncbi:MAG: undecaprenyldiphospho-muramoylpentapeptide beta-N-acetylglucosaminyltransferase [Candidatus Krumholzibacteriia bacterium]